MITAQAVAVKGATMRENMLLTDLDQLTALQACFDREMYGEANDKANTEAKTESKGESNTETVLEFFVRKLPVRRNFLLAGGLEQVVDYLENVHVNPEELAWLTDCGHFHQPFIDSLSDFRFTGALEAMPEGTVFFPNEPILRIVAPLRETRLIENRIISLLQFQTRVASKAARMRLAAPGKLLVDAGLHHAHGTNAGLFSARASFLAGFDGTSTVLAGVRWGIPLLGTMTDAFVQNDTDAMTAFSDFSRAHPQLIALQIETTSSGRRQVYRHLDSEGKMLGDTLATSGEQAPGSPLLHPVMLNGRRVAPLPTLAASRHHAQTQIAALPPLLRHLRVRAGYPLNNPFPA